MLACFILLLALFNLNNAHSPHNLNKIKQALLGQQYRHEPRIDFIILRQIWPEPTCMFPGEHTCTISKDVSTWVVHGLWPSQTGEIGPTFCNKSMPFDFSKLKPLLADMLKYWPNLYTDTQKDSFWEHEWTKHGTCALGLENIKDEYDYFNVALNLRQSYDFGPILAAQSIIPHDKMLYDVSKIRSAIMNKLNVKPLLVCYIKRDSNIQYFSQMQICMDKQYKLIDCSWEAVEMAKIMVNNDPQETECLEDMPVSYPVIKPALWGTYRLNRHDDDDEYLL